jgi:NPCBM/NEW2 domain
MRRGEAVNLFENQGSHENHKGRKTGIGQPRPFLYSCLFVFFSGTFACWGQSRPEQPRLILLDGSQVAFQSLEVAGSKLTGDGVPADLTLDDLRRIEVSEPTPAAAKPAILAELSGGARVLATSATIADERVQLGHSDGKLLTLPLDLVRVLRLEPMAASADFDKAAQTPSAEFDRIFIKDDEGKLSSISGLVESLTADILTFEAGDQSRKLPRSKLFGIIVAQPAAGGTPPRCLLTLKDGSQLGSDELTVAEGIAELTFAGGGKAKLPWTAISRVAIRSRRVAFLSDLKPSEDQQQPILTLPRPAQRDRAVTSKPLMLGGRAFEKGIGVHSRSLLAFDAEKKWDVLAATIGLDSDSGAKGDCVFVVLADGQPLLTRRMKGSDPPEEVNLSISGRQQVTLLVEPGEGLDLADHANWGDVRFVKNRD